MSKRPADRPSRIRAPWAGSKAIREAWSVGERITPSEWARATRVLTEKESAEPGNWNNDRTPYLVEPMDALGDPDISDVVIMKAAQVGCSEMLRNVIGYWIDQDPGPVLSVMPDEESAKEILGEKFAPLIRQTPCLAARLTTKISDVSKRRINLTNMAIFAGWAGSPQSLASRPIRYALFDEADKFPAWSGKEADPISLGNKRTTTYGHRAKRLIQGTPTTRNGPIFQAWESSPVRKRFHVPCHACGVYNAPAWTDIRWPELEGSRAEQALRIEQEALAWYECPSCKGKIRERHKAAIMRRGRWAADGYETVAPDGSLIGKAPKSRRVAYHIPATLSPWVPWSEMASEFVAAIGSDSKMMDWRNSRLGEPFEIRAAAIKADIFEDKARRGHKPRLVPEWATQILATADTQKDYFIYVVRAWGPGFRSRLLSEGRADSFADLKAATLGMRVPVETGPGEPPRSMPVAMLGIDSGGGTLDENSDLNRTHQVYSFAISDPARIIALKGWGGARELESPVRQAWISYTPPDGSAPPSRVALYHLRTNYFKDILAARVANTEKDLDSWEVHAEISEAYRRQMSAQHKVIVRKGRQQAARWVPIAAGAADHFFDCETYQIALSQIAHVEIVPLTPRKYGFIGRVGV